MSRQAGEREGERKEDLCQVGELDIEGSIRRSIGRNREGDIREGDRREDIEEVID